MADKKLNSEIILRKSQEEMSDIEKMMADIIDNDAKESSPAQQSVSPKISTVTPPSKMPKSYTTQAEENAKYTVTPEPRMGDEEPIKKKSTARSKYRKKKKVFPVIAILCAIILVGGIILGSAIKNLAGDEVDNIDESIVSGAKPTPNDGLYIPTPEPGDALNSASMVLVEDEKEEEKEEKTPEEKYIFRCEDISWTDAKKACEEVDGHLITISSKAELDEAIALTMLNDCNYLWIGCHRENGELIWENDEDIDYYVWDSGEPSKYDSKDNVYEDYIMLWKHGGEWVYNDSRNDPCADYGDMYSGKMGYIIEYD